MKIKLTTIFCLLLFFSLMGCHSALRGTQPPDLPGATAEPLSPSENKEIATSAGWGKTPIPVSDYPAGDNTDRTLADHPLTEAIGLPPEKPVKTQNQAALDEALELCTASQDFWQKGEFDNALQTLDLAYALLTKVEENNTTELIQQKDDIRFLVAKRILEIYASRNSVVNGDHNAIPLMINKEVQKEIDLFTRGCEKKFFSESYQRSGKYRPFIIEKLQAAGLPTELSWLPLIESGFKTNALSSARALGLWQFIPSTGYKFGLERNVYVDERLDPEKSTEAAIKYLTALHQMFGDWSTVLAAYNSGENRVLRTISTQKINYLDDFWDLYHQLPFETARYVPRFLATLHIVSDPGKYGLTGIAPDPPITYEVVTVSRQAHLKEIAAAIDVAENDLKELNPELRHQILPPGLYPLKIPTGKKDRLLAAIDTLPVATPPSNAFVYHRVRTGETLSTIAKRYRTTANNIARANNIFRQNHIRAGRLLKIPLGRNWAAEQSLTATRTAKTAQHTVRRGESLWIIAQRYGTTVNSIQRLNNLSSTALDVGQTLKIPVGGAAQTYLVKPGDNPFTIAKRHGLPLEKFLELNHLQKNSPIFPGQSVYVK